MAVDAEVGAIIGGCVAGAVILVAIVAVLVYLFCGKRRRKKEREQKKFHQLTPHTSPAHSQPSTLGHGPPGPDPRLPKVGSNGLWMGTPGIYAGTPSPAYFYGRPGSKPHHNHLMQPAVMQRASSETRIPQRGQVPAGPAVYTTGSQQRIYHSQQLAGLTPVYEVMDPRNGSIYDVYQIGGGSRTKLLQEGGKSSDRHSKSGKRLDRSQSDVITDPGRRPHRNKPSHDGHRASKASGVTKERAQVHETRDTAPEEPKTGFENPAFHESAEKIIKEEDKVAVVGSATDSMKLLAKNKTDDQKTVVHSAGPSSSSSSSAQASEKKPSPASTPAPVTKSSSLHYTTGDDIYAVPDKEEARRRSRSDNPILARMQDMIIERSEGVVPAVVADPVTDIAETEEPLLIMPREGDSPGRRPVVLNPVYQEVEEVLREGEGVDSSKGVRTSATDSATELAAAAARSATDELDGGANGVHDAAEDSRDLVVSDVAASSAVKSLRDAGASGNSGGDDLETTVVKDKSETRWSTDSDGATDELSRAGKHIIVTAEAFEFLDTYLSDEDGGDIHSPPQSPVLSDRGEMIY